MTTTTTNAAAAAPRFATAAAAHRAVAFGLAAMVSLALLAGVSMTADHTHDQALLAQAPVELSGPVQVVVITGQRLPRG